MNWDKISAVTTFVSALVRWASAIGAHPHPMHTPWNMAGYSILAKGYFCLWGQKVSDQKQPTLSFYTCPHCFNSARVQTSVLSLLSALFKNPVSWNKMETIQKKTSFYTTNLHPGRSFLLLPMQPLKEKQLFACQEKCSIENKALLNWSFLLLFLVNGLILWSCNFFSE